ncbi:MAG TPA: hypothetical protein VGN63_19430 [Flavisolibacter sp.]|jgi:hypothetical protein|nr:hypothetical protein [Flavisolibacter sp.]
MSSNNASLYIDFHNQANHAFFSLEKDFILASEKVNRDKEEFRFQQLKKDYVNELKRQLEISAQELLKRNGLTQATGHDFNDFIKEYLYRFVQKINAY